VVLILIASKLLICTLQVAFVASVTASYEEDGASDYIARMDLKTNVDHLLSTAYDATAAAATGTTAAASRPASTAGTAHVYWFVALLANV
jgi:ribosomal protein L12E/L44/L45/RPP1/RPP2